MRKQIHDKLFISMISKTQGQIDEMWDSGMFNTIIEGYVALAMLSAGFTNTDVRKINFNVVFDTYTAADARKCDLI